MPTFSHSSSSWAEAGIRRMPASIHAFRQDSRFSYTLHVPPNYHGGRPDARLLVLIHDTTRDLIAYREAFAALSEACNCVLLAPLFPGGVKGNGDLDGYKQLIEEDIRYNELLLAMVDEVAEALETDFPKFMLFGYSGGGQFALRFLYLHAQRLSAVSIGAPGSITHLNEDFPWPFGIQNIGTLFGRTVDREALRQVRVQLVVGADDTEFLQPPPDRQAMQERMGDYSHTRVEHMDLLQTHLQAAGVPVRLDVVPGLAHFAEGSFSTVEAFFRNFAGLPG